MAESETQADRAAGVQWEYHTTRIVWVSSEWRLVEYTEGEYLTSDERAIAYHLVMMGTQGWELCSILPDADDHEFATMFFKRRR